MDIQQVKNYSTAADANNINSPTPTPPSASSVQAFNQQMNDTGSADNAAPVQNKMAEQSDAAQDQMKDILGLLIQLLQLMMTQLKGGEGNKAGDEQPQGGSTASPDGGVKAVEAGPASGPTGGADGVTPGSSGSSDKIPAPVDNVQQLNLGGKTVTVGGDGTGSASATEVAQTAESIENMYQNSPTFKSMIDDSSDPSFEVSVGRRDDNTSWGNSGGKIFMNVNNVAPGNSDTWQGLLAHEFAHASIDLGHGSEMERIEKQAASEA